ncbi:MAG: magnesium transporter CorA family protein [Bacteroidales bacterium]|nr:magnesium transporter CorA family protein [Bacteroidales bacterium]MDD3960381.1 magnesium transporter CorA family protein [Bacteroidales bacterium]HPE86642.1 magnesium transporter CorA family protein [Bacteroidales bacterium]
MIDTIKFGTLKWHHIFQPTDDDLQHLLSDFHFHPLDIEDCKSYNQRPKIDIYDDYYFLILHFPYFDRQNRFLKTREVKIFWGEDYVITIGKSHWVVRDLFQEAKYALDDEKFQLASSDQLLYVILEKLMIETMKLVRQIGSEVDTINRELFSKRSVHIIEVTSIVRKNIIMLNTIFKPQLRLFHKFESGEIEGYADNMEDYWGNILDYYQKMWDMTEDYAEIIDGLSMTFDSLQANKTNEIMKILTFISTIVLPLTFLTGLYGMNVNLPMDQNAHTFWFILGLMALIAALMIFYFKRKHWM